MSLFVNTGAVVAGLVLLLLGVSVAGYGFLIAGGAEASYAVLCSSGQAPASACAVLLSTANAHRTLAYIFTGVFVLGVALAVAGVFMEERSRGPSPVLMPPPAGVPNPWKTCANCRSMMPAVDRFCGACGAPQL